MFLSCSEANRVNSGSVFLMLEPLKTAPTKSRNQILGEEKNDRRAAAFFFFLNCLYSFVVLQRISHCLIGESAVQCKRSTLMLK